MSNSEPDGDHGSRYIGRLRIAQKRGGNSSHGHGTSEKCGSRVSCRSRNYFLALAYCHVRGMWQLGDVYWVPPIFPQRIINLTQKKKVNDILTRSNFTAQLKNKNKNKRSFFEKVQIKINKAQQTDASAFPLLLHALMAGFR